MPNLRCGRPANPFSNQGVLDISQHTPDQFLVQVACPYVSQSGLQTLVAQLGGQQILGQYQSRWIIGIDRALTEPRALQTILGWPAASLHIFCPRLQLDRAALRWQPRLHAKIVGVVDSASNTLVRIFASSANITSAALGPNAQNFEVGLLHSQPNVAESEEYIAWWDEIRANGIQASEDLIRRYADLRQRFLAEVPDRFEDLDPPAPIDIRMAQYLWIETGGMSGPPEHRHQIEFAEELAMYFQAPRANMDVNLSFGNGAQYARPLTFRGTAQGQFVEIWRLGLLTPRMGGSPYQNRVIRFERLGNNAYRFEVDDCDGTKARRWLREANRLGYVGRTGGRAATRRQFGFY